MPKRDEKGVYIQQDGKTYRRTITGKWEAEKTFWGNDKVERDLLGNPKVETDFLGRQKIETDWKRDPYVPLDPYVSANQAHLRTYGRFAKPEEKKPSPTEAICCGLDGRGGSAIHHGRGWGRGE